VKLLLDVHHSRLAAQRLTAAGYDVVAAADFPDLATLSDEELLRHASVEQRAIVTENAKDFDRIVRSWVATGEHHAGVVFTSPRRFHRGGVAYPENLIASLTQLLESPPETEHDWVHWLQ
jgi:hypothetical protein